MNLHHEGNPTARQFKVVDPEGYAVQHRNEIIGELCGMVEHWKASGMRLASTQSRFNKRGWGNIIGGILDANGDPGTLRNLGFCQRTAFTPNKNKALRYLRNVANLFTGSG